MVRKTRTTKRVARKTSSVGRKTKSVARKVSSTGRKSVKKDKVPTGIPNFDKLIEGGFEKNSTNLVAGNAGSGKTIFSTQFLVAGMKKGEACLYVTFEEQKEDFYKNMRRFGWDLEAYEKKELFTFLQYTPIKVKTMLEEGGGTIESIILRKKITRIVIDSITSFALLFEDELEKREAALDLFSMISKWNATALVTLEGKPSQESRMSAKTLEFESDSIILLYYPRHKGERKRFLEILKMRGTKHSPKVYSFDISNKGINIGSSSTNVKL